MQYKARRVPDGRMKQTNEPNTLNKSASNSTTMLILGHHFPQRLRFCEVVIYVLPLD